jgi:Flp pilus assembly protein TadG
MKNYGYLHKYAFKHAKRHKALAYLFMFIGIVFPIFIAFGAITTDITHLYLARRSVVDAAIAAVQAGSNQIASGSTSNPYLSSQAIPVADATWNFASSQGALSLTNDPSAATFTATTSPGAQPTTITATVTYKVTGLTFLQYLLSGPNNTPTFTLHVSAGVCIPGQSNGPSFGNCVTPVPY